MLTAFGPTSAVVDEHAADVEADDLDCWVGHGQKLGTLLPRGKSAGDSPATNRTYVEPAWR